MLCDYCAVSANRPSGKYQAGQARAWAVMAIERIIEIQHEYTDQKRTRNVLCYEGLHNTRGAPALGEFGEILALLKHELSRHLRQFSGWQCYASIQVYIFEDGRKENILQFGHLLEPTPSRMMFLMIFPAKGVLKGGKWRRINQELVPANTFCRGTPRRLAFWGFT
jgi:hypothetical protein